MGLTPFPATLCLHLANLARAQVFIETGTYLGETARWAAKFFSDVRTVELGAERYADTSAALRDLSNVVCYQGDDAREHPDGRGCGMPWIYHPDGGASNQHHARADQCTRDKGERTGRTCARRQLHQHRASYCAAGTEKCMRLVQRMRHQVQQCHLPGAQATLHQHETHLRAGRPGEHHLDTDARGHHQRRQHRRCGADGNQQRLDCRHVGYQRGEPNQHETTQVDDARVQQRGHRRGGFHDLDQPAVKRQLCALE